MSSSARVRLADALLCPLLAGQRRRARLPRAVLEVLLLQLELSVGSPAAQLPKRALGEGFLADWLPGPEEDAPDPVQLTGRVLALAHQASVLGVLTDRAVRRRPVEATLVPARLVGPRLLERAGVVELARGDGSALGIDRQLLLRLAVQVVALPAGQLSLRIVAIFHRPALGVPFLEVAVEIALQRGGVGAEWLAVGEAPA